MRDRPSSLPSLAHVAIGTHGADGGPEEARPAMGGSPKATSSLVIDEAHELSQIPSPPVAHPMPPAKPSGLSTTLSFAGQGIESGAGMESSDKVV
jgi:hypothetical protein